MSDSNDGSSEVPPKSPDRAVDKSGLREREGAPAKGAGEAGEAAAKPVSGAPGAGPALPAVPGGVMERAAAKPTAGVGTSLMPNTEPSAELAARAEALAPAPAPAGGPRAVAMSDEEGPMSVAPPTIGESRPSGPPAEALDHTESQPSVLQVLAPHLTEEQVEARRKDKLRGLVIIGVTFVGCILLSVWGKAKAEPEESLPPRPPTTEGLSGWPDKVDPFATLELARSISQRDLLRGIIAEQVNPDGTVNFKHEKGAASVRYSFQSEPGHGPQPPRDPGKVPPRSYCGKQSVHIQRHGIVADPDVPAFPCPSKPRESLPDPECTTKQLWDYALTKGVTQAKPARIEYFSAKAGPAYRFTVPGTQHRIVVGSDCKTEIKNRDAHGGVP